MRLWSLHPSHLDRAALVAGWREGLLAQKVLAGLTKGYTRHPAAERFRAHPEPMAAIGAWLREIHNEATRRGYSFDRTKINADGDRPVAKIPLTTGQLAYEADWLREKVEKRAPELLGDEPWVSGEFLPHPLFDLVEGDIEPWEKI